MQGRDCRSPIQDGSSWMFIFSASSFRAHVPGLSYGYEVFDEIIGLPVEFIGQFLVIVCDDHRVPFLSDGWFCRHGSLSNMFSAVDTIDASSCHLN